MASAHTPLPRHYAMTALTVALALGLVLCYFISLPFLPALVWSVTLTVLFAPLQDRIRTRVKLPGVAAAISLLLVILIVVVPIVLVSEILLTELMNSGNLLKAILEPSTWTDIAQRHPELGAVIRWINEQFDLPHVIDTISLRLGEWSAGLVQGSITGIISLLVTFYFLFYLLRDRTIALTTLERMLPLSAGEFRMLVERINDTVIASVYGTAVVSALQGFLGGLMFWWLGLPSPVFWGVIMGLLAIVPFLGAFVIWAPVAVVLAMQGQIFSAGLLVLWGTIVVGLVDNILYPILVGRQLALHSVVSFIAIIGGLFLFGAHGIVLGPVIMAVSQTLLEIFRNRVDIEQGLPLRGI